ncbi:hypothetical protein VIN7_7832 [Saccharomyces cerevisiae x Saccharomyces kudriavzevii VIN7]|uniref:Uncharacterized protein n=1 Tax=Saccharomyces cerevisiae x Saccharomyces kudriavzevii (strain VIN7) TaxID=1095631 RepID=H0GWG5_SACCK|nr:hypothetical protein VIN7_7832 [Saccharomyces cerevisiae x Saccharomyces kudriavzevii VIN7]
MVSVSSTSLEASSNSEGARTAPAPSRDSVVVYSQRAAGSPSSCGPGSEGSRPSVPSIIPTTPPCGIFFPLSCQYGNRVLERFSSGFFFGAFYGRFRRGDRRLLCESETPDYFVYLLFFFGGRWGKPLRVEKITFPLRVGLVVRVCRDIVAFHGAAPTHYRERSVASDLQALRGP